MTGKMYRIGEASAALGLKSYVLRFWETEFPQLEPVRTEKGQRLYTEEHLDLLKLIKHLLHERGLTIDGARRILNSPDSQKLLQEDSGPMIASEFSSELILGRPFADEEYEDDEPDDPPDARMGDLLDDIIDELEDIRDVLASLAEEMAPGLRGKPDFSKPAASDAEFSNQPAGEIDLNLTEAPSFTGSEDMTGEFRAVPDDGNITAEQEPGLAEIGSLMDHGEKDSSKKNCGETEDCPEEEPGISRADDTTIFNFLRNFKNNPEES